MFRTVPSSAAARRRAVASVVVALSLAAPGVSAEADGQGSPRLTGRAVLPVKTFAPGPVSGQFLIPGAGVRNGIRFPLRSQPVEGFSGIVEGRVPGEYLAMADNGFGNKANSGDFNIRAYYLRPRFKTAAGGSGAVGVHGWIEFRDPDRRFPYPIRNEATRSRVFTGADIDPESIQVDRRGHLWIGDEFGPWVLHFDGAGRLVEAPIELPDGLVALTNLGADHDGDAGTPSQRPITVANSRGIEAMALARDGRSLYVILEGAALTDSDPSSRRIYRYDLGRRTWTRIGADYRTDVAAHLVADAQAIDQHRLLVIERDAATLVRNVYEIDLRDARRGGVLPKTLVVDLAAIPDPDGVSLPALHTGDVGLGDPFRVTCESIEALRILGRRQLLLGCDNNFPNTGRNPQRADDTELITVAVPPL